MLDSLKAARLPNDEETRVRNVLAKLKDAGVLSMKGVRGVLDRVRQTGEAHLGTETWIKLPRGAGGLLEDVCLNFIYQPIRNVDGRVDSLLVHAVEVTELVRAREAALRLATERRAAYDVLEHGDPVVILDSGWRFTFANAAWTTLMRLPREDVIGKDHWEIFRETIEPRGEYFDAFHRAMSDRAAIGLTHYFPSRDLWAAFRLYPTADGGLAVFVRDVTAEKKSEGATQSRADFERQLIGIVSHDLRSPLTSISLGAQMLLRRETLDGAGIKALLRIQSSAQRCGRMVNDLLDFTQARLGGGIRIVPSAGNVHTVVRQVVEEASMTC